MYQSSVDSTVIVSLDDWKLNHIALHKTASFQWSIVEMLSISFPIYRVNKFRYTAR